MHNKHIILIVTTEEINGVIKTLSEIIKNIENLNKRESISVSMFWETLDKHLFRNLPICKEHIRTGEGIIRAGDRIYSRDETLYASPHPASFEI